MLGLDRADRVALGWLLIVWEPLLILSIVGLAAFMLTMASWARRYGPGEVLVWVLFVLTIASGVGVFTAADHITQTLGAGTPISSPAPGLLSR